MFLVHLLFASLSSQFVLAAPSGCEARLVALASDSAGIQLDSKTLDRTAALLDLNSSEKTEVQSYAAFVAQVLEARAQKRNLLTLHSPYLADQSEKLRKLVAQYLANWNDFQTAVLETLDASAARMRGQIDGLERDLRSGKAQEITDRNKNSMRELLNRVSLANYGQPADLTNFSWAIDNLSAHPERLLFRMKQNEGKFAEELKAKKARASEMAERAFRVLDQIQTLLAGRGEDIDFQSLIQLEIALATVDELGSWGFLPPATTGVGREVALRENYGITFEHVEAGLNAWTKGAAKNIGSEAYSWAKSRIEDTKKSGMVLLPVIGALSHKQLLALAFLPFRPLRFQHQRSWISDMHPGPQRGSDALDFDMSGASGTLGYDHDLLSENDSQIWIKAVNRSFNNWFLMLGGNPEADTPSPFSAANAKREGLTQAVLYAARYLSLHEKGSIPWDDPTQLVRYLFREYFAFDKHELFNPNMMSFFGSEGPDFFADLGVPKTIGEDEIARALDSLIARLMRNPDVDLSADPALKALLERFPSTAYSAKILVLRAVQEGKEEEPTHKGRGWSRGML